MRKKTRKIKGAKRLKRTLKFVDHEEFLLKQLKSPKYAAAYLDECIAESGADNLDQVLDAFRLVAKASGVSRLAQISGISRRTLYKAFSEGGNPTAETLFGMLNAIGLTLTVKQRPELIRKRA